MRNDFYVGIHNDAYLKHYQIFGAKHGQRRFQNYDGSLTPEGRIRYGVGDPRKAKGGEDEKGGKSKEKKKKGFISGMKQRRLEKKRAEQRKAALDKARETKARKAEEKKRAEEYEKNRKDVMMRGKASEIQKYQGNISNAEYEVILKRLDNEAKIASLSAAEHKSRMDKMDNYARNLARVTAWAKVGIDTYNTVADVYNAFSRKSSKDGWPYVQLHNPLQQNPLQNKVKHSDLEDGLEHSAKGSTWKKHKYIRKEGKKYIYKETRTDDYGTTWDIYVNEETGEAVQRNTNFKYEPERPSLGDFVDGLKDSFKKENEKAIKPLDKDEKARAENLVTEGEKLINDILGNDDENKKLAKK